MYAWFCADLSDSCTICGLPRKRGCSRLLLLQYNYTDASRGEERNRPKYYGKPSRHCDLFILCHIVFREVAALLGGNGLVCVPRIAQSVNFTRGFVSSYRPVGQTCMKRSNCAKIPPTLCSLPPTQATRQTTRAPDRGGRRYRPS